MPQFGNFALCLAWSLSLIAIAAGVFAALKSKPKFYDMAHNCTILVFVSSALALFALGYCFVSNDYSLQYVWQFSNRDMESVYKISAIWGGMDGSMLLWAALLAFSGMLVALSTRGQPWRFMSWVLAAFNSSTLFFLGITTFLTNPFRYIKAPFIPPDGNGLNPLLQNPLMAVHPPTLYLGFTTFAVPAAFCLGALLCGSLSNEWIRLTRRWTLVAWGFLTAGIVMGGHWAYVELGWGGFWAWDPVENASFLPWLSGTAFLHSVMVQERKNMLKIWNVWLVVLTYGLTVFGTFLTRSGVVQSVHAFAETDIGWVFLLYLGLVFAGTLALILLRRIELRSERKIESIFSREAAFLINNLLLLSICFATLWGVMFPVLSEALTGVKQTVSIPFFNAVNVPLFLALLFMMGIGPLIAWRKASLASLGRFFGVPFALACVVGLILIWAGVQGFYPILSYALCCFVLLTILGELHRGLKVQNSVAGKAAGNLAGGVSRLLTRHRVRYGGPLVHLGVCIVAIGITASMAHKVERDITLGVGESSEVGRFRLTLQEIKERNTPNFAALAAHVQVSGRADAAPLKVLKPEMRTYFRNRETTSEVALSVSAREDLYLVMVGLDDSGTRAALKVFINPLQVWLWFGAIVMIAGMVVVIIPAPRIRQEANELRAERIQA